MSTVIYHKHHIIPKHMGGTDDPSNLVTLTIEQHAEEHKKLWEEHNRYQDYIAWKALSGQITNAEANRLKCKLSKLGSNNPRYGKPGTMLGRKGLDNPIFGKPSKLKGRKNGPRSEETKQKIRNTLLGKKHDSERIETNRQAQLKKNRKGTEESKLLMEKVRSHRK